MVFLSLNCIIILCLLFTLSRSNLVIKGNIESHPKRIPILWDSKGFLKKKKNLTFQYEGAVIYFLIKK